MTTAVADNKRLRTRNDGTAIRTAGPDPHPNATAVSIMPESDLAKMKELDTTLQSFRQSLADPAVGDMARMLIQARAIATLEKMITPEMMQDVMYLMNSPLGFKTDKVPGKKWDSRSNKFVDVFAYDEQTVKRCLIVAWLSGAKATGNEFNIIAGNCYLTKEFTRPAILRFPGLSHLSIQIGGMAKYGERATIVEAIAEWKLNGEEYSIRCVKTPEIDARIIVNSYATSSPDEIRGKVEAKIYQRILSRLTGLNLDVDVSQTDSSNTIEVTFAPSTEAEPGTEGDSGTTQPGDADSDEPGESLADEKGEEQDESESEDGEGISDSETAKHILSAFESDVVGLKSVNEVKKLAHDRQKLIHTAEWSEDMKLSTIDAIMLAADNRIADIRATRGENSNK